MTHRRTMLAAALGAALVLPLAAVATPAVAADEDYEVLVVGKTLGFRHSSIDEATTAIIALGEANGFTVDVWDPPVGSSPGQPTRTMATTPFTTAEDLSQYATVVFVSTVDGTNNLDPARPTLLDPDELSAFQGYIRDGGGYAGVHAATDTMHTVPWYGRLSGGGARFVSHPRNQTAVQQVEDRTHPSTQHLGDTWTRFDEWYNFNQSPREDVRVLTNLDETSYDPGRNAMGADHPLSWCHNFEGGRSWYTGGGHTEASYLEPDFLQHLLGGIAWSAGAVDGGGDCVTWNELDGLLADLVTWNELDGLLADLVAAGTITADAAERITNQVVRSEALAEAGQSAHAATRLSAAVAQVRAHVTDADARDLLISKVEDLRTWQRDTA
ncbi:ThuA domain-containing protein [Aquipuribacter sp. MA13-6]|uniref:ThuA domain-containing protein n=1 Tax=Aquipuribacter sp. MA13-6 TaxID=3440839 RepID=UPI003EEEA16D